MTRTTSLLLLALVSVLVMAPASQRRGEKGTASSAENARVTAAEEALASGRTVEARALLDRLDEGKLSPERADAAAYLRASLEEEGGAYEQALTGYLSRFSRGKYRRNTTLALAKLRYVAGDYAEAENLLSIFSPGIEKTPVVREGLVTRGLAQTGRGDAPGALQFLLTAEGDLKGSHEEESYYYAVAEAALRSSKPTIAMTALRSLLERHPQGDYAPQALYAMATALDMVGRQADAASVSRQVATRFPLSYEAARVRDRGIRPGTGTALILPMGGGFAVQIGAFSRKDLADGLARELKQSGVEDVSVRQGTDAPAVFRVRAGSFETRDQARALGERLRRERGFSYQVVPR